jgi:hypothetical protein
MKTVLIALLCLAPFVATVQAEGDAEYKRWNLDITYGTPDFVTLEDALGNVHLCWYLTYTVTNNTDADVPLGIMIRAETDTNKKYRDSIHPLAEKALKKKTGKEYKICITHRDGRV